MSRTADVDLYKILENSEIQSGKENKEAVLYALIDFYHIDDFVKSIGESYFCDDVIECTLRYLYIAIRIDEIITEHLEHDIESYREAIGEYEYTQYLEFKKELESEV